jgi:hypothetical protein
MQRRSGQELGQLIDGGGTLQEGPQEHAPSILFKGEIAWSDPPPIGVLFCFANKLDLHNQAAFPPLGGIHIVDVNPGIQDFYYYSCDHRREIVSPI